MSKQLLTLGIVLSLGTVGCAGFGVQQGSSLTAQFQNERGLDNLWTSREETPTAALEAPLYADQGLGDLWSPRENGQEAEASGGETGFYVTQRLGNLWNPSM
jgi:hypothetical protein